MYDGRIAEGMLGHAEGSGGGCIVQLQLVSLGLGVPGDGEAMSEARVVGLRQGRKERYCNYLPRMLQALEK